MPRSGPHCPALYIPSQAPTRRRPLISLVHAFVECRNSSGHLQQEKLWNPRPLWNGITSLLFFIEVEDFFKKIGAEDPLNFECLAAIEDSTSFLEAEQDTTTAEDRKPVTDMRNTTWVLPGVSSLILLAQSWSAHDMAIMLINSWKDSHESAKIEKLQASKAAAGEAGENSDTIPEFEISAEYYDILVWLYKFDTISETKPFIVFPGSDMSSAQLDHQAKFFSAADVPPVVSPVASVQ